MRHISAQYHYVRELHLRGVIKVVQNKIRLIFTSLKFVEWRPQRVLGTRRYSTSVVGKLAYKKGQNKHVRGQDSVALSYIVGEVCVVVSLSSRVVVFFVVNWYSGVECTFHFPLRARFGTRLNLHLLKTSLLPTTNDSKYFNGAKTITYVHILPYHITHHPCPWHCLPLSISVISVRSDRSPFASL